MLKRPNPSAGIFLLACALVVAACGSGSTTPNPGPVFGGQIVDAINSNPNSLLPLLPRLSFNPFAKRVQATIWSPLFYMDGQAMIQPGLATEVPSVGNGDIKVSDNAETVTLKLRPNLKWSDGSPLTANDVVFTINLFKSSPTALRNGFPGAEISSVSAVDSNTVAVTLNTVDAAFLRSGLVDAFNFAPLPQHVTAYQVKTLDDLAQSSENLKPSVASGPFMVQDQQSGDHITAVKNLHYYQAPKPYLDKIVFEVFPDLRTVVTALQAGQVDAASLLPVSSVDTIKNIPGVELALSTDASAFEALWLNLSNSILKDAQVRLALAISVDTKQAITTVWRGIARPTCDDAIGTFAHEPDLVSVDGRCAYGTDKQTYDPNKAAQILDADGWTKGSDGFRHKNGKLLELRISTSTTATPQNPQYHLATEQVVEAAWKTLGVKVDEVNYSGSDLFSSLVLYPPTGTSNPNYDVAEFAYSLGLDPDDHLLWQKNQTPQQGGQNITFYSNPGVDTLEQQQLATPDPLQRLLFLKQIHRHILADVPIIFLYDEPDICACSNQHLRNYNPSGVGPSETWNVQDWWNPAAKQASSGALVGRPSGIGLELDAPPAIPASGSCTGY
jgi:peptide/nickel transport system substrate-binding protein